MRRVFIFDRLCKKVTLIFCGKSLFHFKFWFRFRFVFIAWKQRHLSALNISSIMRKKKNISHVKTCYKLRLKGSRFLTFVKIWTVLSKNGDLVMSFLCIIIYSVKRLGRVNKLIWKKHVIEFFLIVFEFNLHNE